MAIAQRETLRIAAVVSFYFVISIALVIVNKAILNYGKFAFPHPIAVTWFQFVVALVCAAIMGSLGRVLQPLSFMPPLEYKLQRALAVAPLTFSYLAMITLSNLCLKYVEASFYQVARSLHILFNVILTFTMLGQTTSFLVLQSCGLVFVGYLVGSYGEVNFSWLGVGFGVAASFFTAANAIYVKKTLSAVNNDHWLLLYYNTTNSIIALLPVLLLSGELDQIQQVPFLAEPAFWINMTIAAVMGYLINIASFLQIKYTSPLTHMISGTAKGAVQTVLSVMIFGNPITSMNALGTAIVIGASTWYSYIRYAEMRAHPKVDKPVDEQAGKSTESLTIALPTTPTAASATATAVAVAAYDEPDSVAAGSSGMSKQSRSE